MRDVARFRSGVLCLTVVLAACSEAATPPTEAPGARQAAVAGDCDLLKSMPADARSFFIQPEQKTAQDIIKLIGEGCSAGNQTATTAQSWQLLSLMESVLDQNRAGSPAAGSQLANKLLACTASLCNAAALPGINFVPALAQYGLFAVRGNNATDALSRGAQPFVDFQGKSNSARWGVEVDQPWPAITGVPMIVVYGAPETTLAVQELHVGNLRYDLKTWPDVAFAEGLHVGTCFASEVELPEVAGANPAPRMRREGILLETATPGFCPPPVQSASIFGSFAALARKLLPGAIADNFLAGEKASGVGGTAADFSRFAPVASNANGVVEFVAGPNNVVIAGQSIGVIQVRVRSGDGTPMERALVTLTIRGNNGEPAGADLTGDLTSFTQELNGGIATFPDNGGAPVVVGKAGGYRLCATASQGGFVFGEICSDVFNARNP